MAEPSVNVCGTIIRVEMCYVFLLVTNDMFFFLCRYLDTVRDEAYQVAKQDKDTDADGYVAVTIATQFISLFFCAEILTSFVHPVMRPTRQQNRTKIQMLMGMWQSLLHTIYLPPPINPLPEGLSLWMFTFKIDRRQHQEETWFMERFLHYNNSFVPSKTPCTMHMATHNSNIFVDLVCMMRWVQPLLCPVHCSLTQ